MCANVHVSHNNTCIKDKAFSLISFCSVQILSRKGSKASYMAISTTPPRICKAERTPTGKLCHRTAMPYTCTYTVTDFYLALCGEKKQLERIMETSEM